jgi:hypothetical protein
MEPKLHLFNLMLKTTRKSQLELPWWLEDGTEICPACGQTYVYETGYRCAGCDMPICSICVEYEVAAELLCQICVECESEY